MNEEYFSNIFDQIPAIKKTLDKYAGLIYSDPFFKRFEDLLDFDFDVGIISIPVYLFIKYKSGHRITIDDYEEEFVRCVGLLKFEEKIKGQREELGRTFLLIQNFLQE